MNTSGKEEFGDKIELLEKWARSLQEEAVSLARELNPRKQPFYVIVNEKGRSVVTTDHFQKGDTVCAYEGELITGHEGRRRNRQYSEHACYLFFFKYKGNDLCLDATKETFDFGRLINHSRKCKNIKPVASEIGGIPGILFKALTDIHPGTELLYDYGEWSKEAIRANPWLLD